MKKTYSVITILFLFSVLALYTSAPSHAGNTRGVTDKTITIGAILTMTGPGASCNAAPLAVPAQACPYEEARARQCRQ